MSRMAGVVSAAVVSAVGGGAVLASPPTPDHVVIVIEENHSLGQVIGSAEAPYINSLAAAGMSFTSFYAITHPSQPNYLQFFSGASQGVTSDTVPAAGAPFSTANLGAELIAAARTFAGYSEDLPALGSTVGVSGSYYRKHNPWVNWQAAAPGVNQMPASVNRPFFTTEATPRAFYGDVNAPTDYSGLPTVCIVVPNQLNDMHDGTIAEGDAWLQANIGPYAAWAMGHNSLLIVTWDEDNFTAANGNRIPTILYGPMVRTGTSGATWTLHNLLRTVEEMYGAGHAGAAADVRSIVGAFAGDALTATVSFRQGAGGYAAAHDTYIEGAAPAATHGADTLLVADGSPLSQSLIRFDGIIGSGPGQVPAGAALVSAKLMMRTGTGSSDLSQSTMSVHRMLTAWSETSTWSSLGAGVSTNGVEAAATADFGLIANVLAVWAIFDVTESVQAWAAAPGSNQGWVVNPSGTDGWRWVSSEAATVGDRPVLEVTYVLCAADWDGNGRIEPADVGAYVNAWFADLVNGTLVADFDHSGTTTPADVGSFISAWFAALSGQGCGP